MPISFEENTGVITLDGKKIGKVKRIKKQWLFYSIQEGNLDRGRISDYHKRSLTQRR
jgi:hypothetical protein